MVTVESKKRPEITPAPLGRKLGRFEPQLGYCAADPATQRVMEVIPKRFGKYGLTVHPTKTKLVPFRPPFSKNKGGRGSGNRPGTLDFLGFTHYWVCPGTVTGLSNSRLPEIVSAVPCEAWTTGAETTGICHFGSNNEN